MGLNDVFSDVFTYFILLQSTGAYVRGLYMEGARWCRRRKRIEESMPKILYDLVPVVSLFLCLSGCLSVFVCLYSC